MVFEGSSGAVRTAAAAVVAALTLAACGSTAPPATGGGSSAASSSTAAGGGTAAATSTPAPIAAACSLLTAGQVTALLGGNAAQSAGKEDDFSPTYKSCDWLDTPPSGANQTALDLRVFVRASQSAPGFASTIADDGPSTPLTGVGDSAMFAATDGTGANLIVNKGLTAVSISSQGPAASASLKAAMVSAVQQVLAAVGA